MTFDFDQELVGSMPDLARYARRLTRNASEAEDLVQDCIERALRHREKFEPGTNLPAWLTTILKNLHFTRHKRERRVERTDLHDDTSTTEPVQESHVMLREVGEAMEHLSPVHRRLIEVVAIEGRSYQDAADTLDVSIGTIRSRLFRARTQLRSIRRVRRPMPQAVRSPAPPPTPPAHEPAAAEAPGHVAAAAPAAQPTPAARTAPAEPRPDSRRRDPRLPAILARRRIELLLDSTALRRPEPRRPVAETHRRDHPRATRQGSETPDPLAGSPATASATGLASCHCWKHSASPPSPPSICSSDGCAGSTAFRAADGSPSPEASRRPTSSYTCSPSLQSITSPSPKAGLAARSGSIWSI